MSWQENAGGEPPASPFPSRRELHHSRIPRSRAGKPCKLPSIPPSARKANRESAEGRQTNSAAGKFELPTAGLARAAGGSAAIPSLEKIGEPSSEVTWAPVSRAARPHSSAEQSDGVAGEVAAAAESTEAATESESEGSVDLPAESPETPAESVQPAQSEDGKPLANWVALKQPADQTSAQTPDQSPSPAQVQTQSQTPVQAAGPATPVVNLEAASADLAPETGATDTSAEFNSILATELGSMFAASESSTANDPAGAGKPKATTASKIRVAAILIVILILICLAAWIAVTQLIGREDSTESVTDYSGSGEGSIEVVVESGHTGTDIAQTLYDAGVIATVDAFVQACSANTLCQTIQPGTYQVALRMSAAAALEALLDSENRIADNAIPVNTGQTVEQVKEAFLAVGFTETEFEDAIADTDTLGLPSVANGDLEGWLASGTYERTSTSTVADLLSEMIADQISILEATGAAESEWETILTKASIVEREVAFEEYMPQVARVIENRLTELTAETYGYLQMDSTVLYGVGKTGGVPTQTDLEDDNPYNTYLYQGLPPTPIAVPSQAAIKAVVNPASGNWLYFVTVNLETGETLFAETLAEHNENVAIFSEYCTENPGIC